MESDVRLDSVLELARGGDEDAFAVLWRALHPALLRYLGARGDDAVEDLAAETWMHVLRGLNGFVGGYADFRAWLFTIARHRAVDAGRSRARRPQVAVADCTEISDQRRAPAPSAEQVVDDQHSTEHALALVATLPPSQAELVLLRVVAGLDVAEVARLVGKRPGTVRVAIHRALRTLADHPSWSSTDDAGDAGDAGDAAASTPNAPGSTSHRLVRRVV